MPIPPPIPPSIITPPSRSQRSPLVARPGPRFPGWTIVVFSVGLVVCLWILSFMTMTLLYSRNSTSAAVILFLAVAGIGLLFYIIPSLVAYSHKHPHADAICAVNLLLGWTLLGWTVALAWPLMPVKPTLCPICGNQVPGNTRICPHCKTNYEIAIMSPNQPPIVAKRLKRAKEEGYRRGQAAAAAMFASGMTADEVERFFANLNDIPSK